MRLVPVLAAAIAALIGAGALYLALEPSGPVSGTLSGGLPAGGPFELVDSHGRTVTDKSFAGKPVLLYFGYTFCPDVCPTQIQTLSAALDLLGDKGKTVRILFVTIDPERDTPSVIGDFAGNFGPQVVGLTGSPEQVATAARAYGVFYQKVPLADAQGDYMMDHSTAVYFLGKDGHVAALFTPEQSADQIAAILKKFLT